MDYIIGSNFSTVIALQTLYVCVIQPLLKDAKA